ncbi:serine hydrolase [Acetobacteraceae bacterium H6797]|nr:serine hydrolase [Acetobacteraceae bacterium H6797]
MTISSEGARVPGAQWDFVDPALAGFDAARLAAVDAHLATLPTTSLMVVKGAQGVHRYGDIAEVSYLASARKSVMSMLYGPYVAAGKIDLDLTMEALGIDDVEGLLPIERQARLRDILTSRSGVYYPAGSPGGDETAIPPRGSQQPGTYFHYNNWDFNVAGAVFEQLTGIAVHDALEQVFARPLGFEDFDRSRQRMLGYPDKSRFLAYHMFLSARDMARLGLLALREGDWGGQRIIPAEWMRESTRTHVRAEEMHGRFHAGHSGYGYYWWTPRDEGRPEWKGSFLASGHFGQFILVLPAVDMVIVHRRAVSDAKAMARNSGADRREEPAVSSGQFLKIAEMILAARQGA